jgi:hypothetical protein
MPNEIIYSRKDEITEVLDAEIKNEIKRRKIPFYYGIFTPSRLTECDRRILYRANGEVIEENRLIEDFLLNRNEEYVKNKWIDFFSNSIKIKLLEKKLVVADCNYNIAGTLDCIIKKGNAEFVVLIKKQDGEPRRKDVIELMVYLWLAEKSHGVLIYDSNNSNKFILYHVKIFEPIIIAISNKCKKLIETKMKGELPDRPYKNEKNNECFECEFKLKCWQEINNDK